MVIHYGQIDNESSLVQIMAIYWNVFPTSQLAVTTMDSYNGLATNIPEPERTLTHWGRVSIRKKIQWNFNRNSNIFIKENVFENIVCKMGSISSRVKCVKWGQVLFGEPPSRCVDCLMFIFVFIWNRWVSTLAMELHLSYTNPSKWSFVCWWWKVLLLSVRIYITYSTRGQHYRCKSRWITFLLMPWLLSLSGHQQL